MAFGGFGPVEAIQILIPNVHVQIIWELEYKSFIPIYCTFTGPDSILDNI